MAVYNAEPVAVPPATLSIFPIKKKPATDMHVIDEDGVRKRVGLDETWRPPPLPLDMDPVEELLEPAKNLSKRYKFVIYF